MFSDFCDIAFPGKEIEVEIEYLSTPWITKGLSLILKSIFMKNLWK